MHYYVFLYYETDLRIVIAKEFLQKKRGRIGNFQVSKLLRPHVTISRQSRRLREHRISKQHLRKTINLIVLWREQKCELHDLCTLQSYQPTNHKKKWLSSLAATDLLYPPKGFNTSIKPSDYFNHMMK